MLVVIRTLHHRGRGGQVTSEEDHGVDDGREAGTEPRPGIGAPERIFRPGTWAVVDAGWSPNCNEQKGAGVRIYTGGGESVCIVDLSLDDPVESDAATGSVPRELLVLLLPGLLALGLL